MEATLMHALCTTVHTRQGTQPTRRLVLLYSYVILAFWSFISFTRSGQLFFICGDRPGALPFSHVSGTKMQNGEDD